VNLAVHFIKTSSSRSSEPFLLYYAICWSSGEKKENCGEGRDVEKIDRSLIID